MSLEVVSTEAGFLSYARRVLAFPLMIVVQLAASALGGIGFVLGSPPSLMIAGTALWLVWFAGLFWIALPSSDSLMARASRIVRIAGISAFALLMATGIFELVFVQVAARLDHSKLLNALHSTFSYNDATALCHQATDNLLEGRNPYSNANVVTALEISGGASDKITPRREGQFASVFPYPTPAQLDAVWKEAEADPAHPPPEIETRMNYPAGAFELPAPFFLAGIRDIRWVYFLYTVPALIAVVWLAPSKLRLPLAAVLLVGLTFWNSIAGGETGSLAFPFMLLGWVLARKHPYPSAAFMGMAVAIKQTAWFLMPFYLVLLLRTIGMRRTIAAGSLIAGVFVAANLPFMIRDPGLWINSMGAPMSEDFFPLGGGIISFVTSGLVSIKSPSIFTLAEGMVLGVGLAWYYANCRKYPHTGPVLAFFPLFFAWRSLWSYFFYIDVIVLSSVIIDEYGPRLERRKRLSEMKVRFRGGQREEVGGQVAGQQTS